MENFFCCVFLFFGNKAFIHNHKLQKDLHQQRSLGCQRINLSLAVHLQDISPGRINLTLLSTCFRWFSFFFYKRLSEHTADENVNFGPASLFDSTSGPSRELFLKHEIEQRRKQEVNSQWSDSNFRFYFTHNSQHSSSFQFPNPQGNTSSTASASTIVVVGQTHFPILAQSKSERIFPSLARIHHLNTQNNTRT